MDLVTVRTRLFLPLVLAAAILGMAFTGGGVAAEQASETKPQLRVLTYNIYHEDLDAVLKTWAGLTANSDQVPIVSGGDFNSVSHLDDGKGAPGHSKLMSGTGFIDSYRELHPDVSKDPGYSNGGASSRIDYIYYKGKGIRAIESCPIVPDFNGKEELTPGYPSDHLGIVTRFRINTKTDEKEVK